MNKLIIKSSNPDWNGTYTKSEIMQEMRDLLYDAPEDGNDWIYWVLDHMFDSNDLTIQMEKFIAECDELQSLTLKLKDETVIVTKL